MSTSSINLLLIQADPGYASLIAEALGESNNGFHLERAQSLAAGLDRLAAGGIELVLLDLHLPDCSGLKAFAKIRHQALEIPVIILSDENDENLAVKTVRLGAQDYLTRQQISDQLLCRAIRYAIERSRAEQALAEERNLLRTLVDSLPDQVYIKDRYGRFVLGNQALAQGLGLETPDIVGRTDFDFLSPELAVTVAAEEELIMRTGRPQINRAEVNDRRDRHFLTTKAPLRDSRGAVIGLVGIERDITGLIKAETELRLSMDILRQAMEGTVQAMALTVEIRDPYTAGHQRRVAELASAIAREMNLPQEQIESLSLAAAIHDIGKISVPAEILSKPGKITETEFEIIKTHPRLGYDILKTIDFPWPIAEIVLRHHQRLDGSGYPALDEPKFCMESSILGVADVVEAMSSHRPYRAALGIEKALEEISRGKGIRYDPAPVSACLKLFRVKGFRFTEEELPDKTGTA